MGGRGVVAAARVVMMQRHNAGFPTAAAPHLLHYLRRLLQPARDLLAAAARTVLVQHHGVGKRRQHRLLRQADAQLALRGARVRHRWAIDCMVGMQGQEDSFCSNLTQNTAQHAQRVAAHL